MNIDRAIASARRDAYRAAVGMTTTEMLAAERDYRVQVPGPVTGEALVQLRMMRAIQAQRVRSTRSRTRAAAEFRRYRQR